MSADLELYFQSNGTESPVFSKRARSVPGGQVRHSFQGVAGEGRRVHGAPHGPAIWPPTTKRPSWSLLPKPVNVLLVTRGNRLLEKALRAVAQRATGRGE
jgi:hypothetical protein